MHCTLKCNVLHTILQCQGQTTLCIVAQFCLLLPNGNWAFNIVAQPKDFSLQHEWPKGPKFKCQPESGTGWFSYKIWTKNSETHMVNLFKTLGHFEITILKYNFKKKYLLVKMLWQKFSYVIMYAFQSNLLLELILDIGKCPNQKMHESAGCLLWVLPKVQNQFQTQIWLKSIPNYIPWKNFKGF